MKDIIHCPSEKQPGRCRETVCTCAALDDVMAVNTVSLLIVYDSRPNIEMRSINFPPY
jgi:hypothetical protein